MKINDYIRPNPNRFMDVIDESLAEIRKLMNTIAIETNNERRKELSEEIQMKSNAIKALAIRQEEKNGDEMVDIFMEISITRTPHAQGTRRMALYNARKILNQLLSDYLQDVGCRIKLIAELKRELKTTSLRKELVVEIMNEVYGKSRHLSKVMEEVVTEYSRTDFFRAEIALGYLSLIPETTEEEIDILGNKLLNASRHYSSLVEKYKATVRGSIFPIEKGDTVFGIYKKEIFIAKITRIDSGMITCRASFAEEDPLKLKFDLITGISSDKGGILLKNVAGMELFDSQDAKPKEGKLAKYSKYVFARWQENGEEKIGIGGYYFESDKWFISVRDSTRAINISNSPAISWFYIPEDVKKYISGYKI